MDREYLSVRDKLICELYLQGVGVSEIRDRSGISNIYYTLNMYNIPLRADLRQQIKDKVSNEFDNGKSLDQIINKYKLSVKTVLNILRETRPNELNSLIEAEKRRMELSKQREKKKRDIALKLKRIEEEKQRLIDAQKDFEKDEEEKNRQEELIEKKKNIKVGDMSHLKGLLGRRIDELDEKREELDTKYPEREGAHSPLERVLTGKDSPIIKQIRDRDIAYDYVKGMSTIDISIKHGVDLDYVANLLETSGDKPKYFPDRPPLDI